MKIIDNNPYRQLGVYTTSPQKEIVANQGRMKAFLNVGRPCALSMDLDGILPPVSRTAQTVAQAVSALALPADRLKYGQFWFAKCTPLDDIACGKLINGDMDGAIEVWTKKSTVSSLQNQMVCALIRGEVCEAISLAATLYSSYCTDFVAMVQGDGGQASADDLVHGFLDVLCEEFDLQFLLDNVTDNSWRDYIVGKVMQPLIDELDSAVSQAKSSKGQGTRERLLAGLKLMGVTSKTLPKLKKHLPQSDLRYQMIADKAGLEILQCGIDFYNGSDARDAAHEAMRLQSYALSVVVGQMARERCKENVDILTKIIAELPPLEVFDEDRAIRDELRRFSRLPDLICHSVTLLNETQPHLRSIKNKLGASNGYYLKISTQVVGSALHNIIEEVNSVQNDLTFRMHIVLDRPAALSRLQTVLRSAWKATQIMDSFDMEQGFRADRYDANRKTLKKMCGDVGVSTGIGIPSLPGFTPKPPTSDSSSSESHKGCYMALIGIAVCTIIGAILGGENGAFGGFAIGFFICGSIYHNN